MDDIKIAFAGTEEETGWHSVKTYYETLSQNSLSMSFTFSDWYECGYTSTQAGGTYGEFPFSNLIVSEATEWFFENNPSENRTDYDYNGDGYIDGVMTIYGAPDYQAGGFSSDSYLWAYCYWLQNSDADVSNPMPNAYFWSSYDFMYDSTTARSRTGHRYNNGDCSNLNIDAHTFIHETGHVLGYDNDYYDYSGNYAPAGGFSMQDLNVGSHDPYSVMASGWADPYIPTESCTITIGAFQETRDLILLTPEWNGSSSPFDEYLLLELYTPTGLNELDSQNAYQGGYPTGTSRTGIRLWHVDARLTTIIYDRRGNYSYSTDLLTDPTSAIYGVEIAMRNTSYSVDYADYASPLGEGYYDYNLLQLIGNTGNFTNHNREEYFNVDDLFVSGSSFSMSTYSRQFVNGTRLNSGKALGWSFSVSISGSGSSATATIDLVRE